MALLITNVLVLGMWWRGHDGKFDSSDHKSRMGEYLKSDLGFSAAQMTQFDSIKLKQKEDAKQLFSGLRDKKLDLYKNIGREKFTDTALVSAASFSANSQQSLELLMLTHLKAIRNLCTEEQRTKFDTGFYKVMIRDPRKEKKD